MGLSSRCTCLVLFYVNRLEVQVVRASSQCERVQEESCLADTEKSWLRIGKTCFSHSIVQAVLTAYQSGNIVVNKSIGGSTGLSMACLLLGYVNYHMCCLPGDVSNNCLGTLVILFSEFGHSTKAVFKSFVMK